MKKEMKADFFRPAVLSIRNTTFEDLLRKVMELPQGRRTVEISDYPIFVSQCQDGRNQIYGDMVRMRVNEAATKANRKGEVATVDMELDESLGGHSAFLYDIESNIVCLQRNRTGVGSSTMAHYLSLAADFGGSVGLEIIISQEIWERVEAMNNHRAMEVRLAGIQNPRALAKAVPSVAGGINMAHGFGAQTIHFKVSAGKDEHGLTRVMDSIRELMSFRDGAEDEVRTVKITGWEPGADEVETIDLIRHRVYFAEQVEIPRGHDNWYKTRHDFVRRAWDNKKGELRHMQRH